MRVNEPGLARVLEAWRTAFGIDRTVSIDELVAVEHEGLRAALLAVAAMPDTDNGAAYLNPTISNVLLGRWLKGANGVLLGRLFLQHEGLRGSGSQLWSLREGDEVPVDELGAPCAGRASLTQAQKCLLRAYGYSEEEIAHLMPQQAQEILAGGKSKSYAFVSDCPQSWPCSACGEVGNDQKGPVAKFKPNQVGAPATVLHGCCADACFDRH